MSALASSSVIAASLEKSVVRVPAKTSLRWLSRGIERSSTVTRAPIPTATRAAVAPTTPPPMIITRAGRTPGTPPSSTPRPPLPFCRAQAPTCGASRPATSDIGASSGSPPARSVTVS